MQKTALILGATGRFGRNAAEAFWNRGWTIRTFDRTTDDLMRAAEGADVIVNGWNPAYPDWSAQLPGLTAQVQAAARVSDALVILPGNVYVYGGDTPAPWTEDTPHLAQNPLGRLRLEMEQSYRDSGVQTLILRAGDFIDTEASGNWIDRMMLPSLPKGRLTYPGRTDVPHAWAYLPDLTRAAALLAERKADLPRFTAVNFPGYTLTGEEMAAILSDLAGGTVTARRMSWLPLRLAAPVWTMGRCLLEMRYLWDTPHRLDSTRFEALCPGFRPTPAEEALAKAAAPWLKTKRAAVGVFQSMTRSTQTSL